MEENMQQINIRIDRELLKKIDQKANELSLNRSALMRLACVEYLEKCENKNSEYMYSHTGSPIMVVQGEAAKKIFDKPKKNIPNRSEIIKKAKEELRESGYMS